MLSRMPVGIRYEPGVGKEGFRAGDFVIDVKLVSLIDLKKLRLLTPRDSYLKVRAIKASQVTRIKRKQKSKECMSALEQRCLEN